MENSMQLITSIKRKLLLIFSDFLSDHQQNFNVLFFSFQFSSGILKAIVPPNGLVIVVAVGVLNFGGHSPGILLSQPLRTLCQSSLRNLFWAPLLSHRYYKFIKFV
jgi:hypothetical protein